jgi:hypothetical protein
MYGTSALGARRADCTATLLVAQIVAERVKKETNLSDLSGIRR